jgi:hypothetical protein
MQCNKFFHRTTPPLLTTYPISLGGSGSFGAPMLCRNLQEKKVGNGKELTTAFGGLIRNHSGLQLFFASWMEVR